MQDIEVVTKVQQDALSIYTQAAQRFAEIKTLFPEVTEIRVEHKDVPASTLQELANEYGTKLGYDKTRKCVYYNGLHIEQGGWFALTCYSKPVENPPAENFTVEVEGETFTFKS